LRLIVRIIGWLLIAVALVVLGLDFLAASANETDFNMVPMGQLWFEVHPGSLNLIQALIERYVWPPLWHSGISPILQLPAAAVIAGLGVLLLLLTLIGRKRRRASAKLRD
jgi:hypothetical protein